MNLLIPIVFIAVVVVGYLVFTKKSATPTPPDPSPLPQPTPPETPVETPASTPPATPPVTPPSSPVPSACFAAAIRAANGAVEGWVDYAPCGNPDGKNRITLYAFDHVNGELVENLCVDHIIGSYNASVELSAHDCFYVFPTPTPSIALAATPVPTPSSTPPSEHVVVRFSFNGYEVEAQVTPDHYYVPSLGRTPRTLAECPLAHWFATEAQAVNAGEPKSIPSPLGGTSPVQGIARVWTCQGTVNADHTLKVDSWKIITEVV